MSDLTPGPRYRGRRPAPGMSGADERVIMLVLGA